MVEAKMETLVNKFEALVSRLEQSSGSASDSSKPGQSQPAISNKFDREVLNLVADVESKVKALDNKLLEES